MHPPDDRYPEFLRNATTAYLASGLDAGREVLRPIAGKIWNGLRRSHHLTSAATHVMRPTAGERAFSPTEAAKILRRDNFQCRYCGADTVPKPIAVLLHSLFPAELPFHEHYLDGSMHPLFWTRVAEIDHITPANRGGSWVDPLNRVTACVVCTTNRGDRTLHAWGVGSTSRSRDGTDWCRSTP